MEIEEIRNYCLNCVNKPCSNKGCPLNNDIPAFIHEEDTKKAYEILSRTTVLPAICGSICPHEKQCIGSCIRGIKGEPVSIGQLEAFLGREAIEKGYKIPISNKLKGRKVAVVGSGPAGLTCSAFLAREGISVTIYEKYDKLGGILTHGIPDFRLDKEVVKKTIDKILELGVDVKLKQELGKNLRLENLTEQYDAVFIGIGANVPMKMGIEGENLKGVFGGNTLLETGNHPDYSGKIVCVIGGGNVAMDTARTIKHLGAEKVYVIYRRAEEQMPAERKEIEDAKKEKIEFLFQTNIIKILSDDDENSDRNNMMARNSQSSNSEELLEKKVSKVECIKTKLVKKEGDSRLSPVNIEGSNFFLKADFVVMATGSKPNGEDIKDFEKNKWGYINVNENMETSIDNVFAGGDIVGERATVAWAARSGRDAAFKIVERLTIM